MAAQSTPPLKSGGGGGGSPTPTVIWRPLRYADRNAAKTLDKFAGAVDVLEDEEERD